MLQQRSGVATELVPMTTTGDQMQSGPLSESGGKGLFVKELEVALLEERADIAVHSMKDVPAQFPQGLGLAVVLTGEDPRDAWVSSEYDGPLQLPPGAKVGTASLRRQSQLLCLRPDLHITPLRGNVQTRLSRLDGGDYQAIILACAGLRRLGMAQRIRRPLEIEEMLPAPGQGIVGIETRLEDVEVLSAIAPLADPVSTARIAAERGFSTALSGDCRTPLAAHAEVNGSQLRLYGCVAAPDGTRILKESIDGDIHMAAMLGNELANQMLQAGAGEILEMVNRGE